MNGPGKGSNRRFRGGDVDDDPVVEILFLVKGLRRHFVQFGLCKGVAFDLAALFFPGAQSTGEDGGVKAFVS